MYKRQGFCHVLGGGWNSMANDQATYALVAYWRLENGMRALYDMRGDWTAETREAIDAAIAAIDALPAPDSDVPTVIIGKTVKGHGVSFMENNVSWHAGCVNEADWIKAKAEITEAYERKWGAEA